MPWERKNVFITVKTYPNPAKQGIEVSCTGGITSDGNWIRLFPVPFRFLDETKRFPRYAWIEVLVRKASDSRPESYNLNPDSIKIISVVEPERDWAERKRIVSPLKQHCLCCIKQERDAHEAPTLGIFKPGSIDRFYIRQCAAQWSADDQAILSQGTLSFQKRPQELLEKIPFDFYYRFRCPETHCTGHETKCLDWELYQAYRKWRTQYGDAWRSKLLERFEHDMINRYDTHFFVGTLRAHPREWTIIGLFYPPPEKQGRLL